MPDDPFADLAEPLPRVRYDEDSALDLIAHHESGGRNIKQQVVPEGGGYNPSVGRVTGPSTASGPWQITNTTWRKRAPREIAQQYPTAMSAPVEVQRAVAGKIYRETGFQDWAPYNAGLRKAIARGEQPQAPTEVPKFDDWAKSQSESEPAFQRWYASHAKRLKLDPNPDDPRHQYDYRAAYQVGVSPDVSGHWPSKFKAPNHPNRYVDGVDTITGQPAPLADIAERDPFADLAETAEQPAPRPRRSAFEGATAGVGAEQQQTGLGTAPGSPLAGVFKRPALPLNQPKITVRKPFDFKGTSDAETKVAIQREVADEVARSTPHGRAPRLTGRQFDEEVDVRLQAAKQEQAREVDYARLGPSVSGREAGVIERARTAIAPYTPGLQSLDTPMGIKMDLPRGVASGVTLGAVGSARDITPEERIANPDAGNQPLISIPVPIIGGSIDFNSHELGELAGSLVPLVGGGKVLAKVGAKLSPAKRTAILFGGVESGRQAVNAAAGREVDLSAPLMSAALGSVMGKLEGLNPGLIRRVVAYVSPSMALEIAQGAPPEQVAKSALTNFGFAVGMGGRRAKTETKPPVTPQPATPESVATRPGATETVAQRMVASDTAAAETIRPDRAAEVVEAKTIVRHQRSEIDGAEVVENKGATLIVEKDGKQHEIKNPRTSGNREAALTKTPVEIPPESPVAKPQQPAEIEGAVLTTPSTPEKQPNETLVYRGGKSAEGLGWFTEDPIEAAKYGDVKAYYLRTDKPTDVTTGGFSPSLMKEQGFDAVRIPEPMSKEGTYGNQKPQWIPLDPSQVREAPAPSSRPERRRFTMTDAEYKEWLAKPINTERRAREDAEFDRERRQSGATEDYAGPERRQQLTAQLSEEAPPVVLRQRPVEPTVREGEKLADVERAENEARRQALKADEDAKLHDEAELLPMNPATHDGKPFWIGTVNKLDGVIENTYRHESAAKNDFHHNNYMKDADVEGMNSGERQVFWIDKNNQIQSMEPLSAELKAKIQEQIQIAAQPKPTEPIEKPRLLQSEAEALAREYGELMDETVKLGPKLRTMIPQSVLDLDVRNPQRARLIEGYSKFKADPAAVAADQQLHTKARAIKQELVDAGYEVNIRGKLTASPKPTELSPTERQQEGGEPDVAIEKAAPQTKPTPVSKFSKEDAGRVTTGEPPAPSTTAAKREKVTEDRAARGLEPIPKPERKSDEQLLEDAKAANAADPSKPLRLAEEVLRSPRALSDKETVQLDLRVQEMKNEYDRVLKEIAPATDPAAIKRLGAEADALESETARMEEAWSLSGSEKGRGLRAQRVAIDQDYRLLTMISKAKTDRGRDLNPRERERIETQAKEIETLTTKLAEAEERANTTRLQREIDKVSRQRRRSETKETLDKEAVTIRQNIAAEFARLRGQAAKGQFTSLGGLGSLDPEGVITKNLLKYARNRAKADIGLKAEALIDDAYSMVKDFGATRRQVAEALSGYGIQHIDRRSDAAKRLEAMRDEITALLKAEDVVAGTRSARSEGPRLREGVGTKEGPKLGAKQGPKEREGWRQIEGPRLSEGTNRKAGPRLSEAPWQGPRLTEAPKQGPQLGPRQGPKEREGWKRTEGPTLSEGTNRREGPRLTEAPLLGPPNAPKVAATRNRMRQQQLQKQIAELEQQISSGKFTDKPKREPPRYNRETHNIQTRLDEVKQQYNRDRYRATRSTGGKISDELAKAAGVTKTIKSIGDISAVFRQGGYYAITHPITGGVMPFREMIKSFSALGHRNVEVMIVNDPAYKVLKKAGVEFTGVDKADPNLSKREEGYLGGEYFDLIAKGKYNVPGKIVKGIRDISERTFVSFLDAQRLFVGKQMIDGLLDPGIIARTLGAKRGRTQQTNPEDLQRVARAINSGTGRGNLGPRGNQIAPVLNIAMFSPRLLKSRVELLNNMFNPIAIYNMPRNARAQIIQDNVKFLGATMAVIALTKSMGGTVSLDPDDSEFLKIRFGNTVYDQLMGLQQPLRYVVNMTRAITGGETYPGKSIKEMSDPFEPGSFTRSKLSPMAGLTVDAATGSDFMGRKFDKTRAAKDLVTPLPAKDVIEAMQQEGLLGALKASPTFVGIGIGSYPPAAERPKTHGEKLARKLARPDKNQIRTEEEIERDRKKSDLRARSRRGEDVAAEADALPITDRQRAAILDAKGHPRLQEDFKRLDLKEAVLVYDTLTRGERQEVRDLLATKAMTVGNLPDDEQPAMNARLAQLGLTPPVRRPKRLKGPSRLSRSGEQGYQWSTP